MDYEFLKGFSPKLMDVVERNPTYWDSFHYQLFRERTLLHILAYVHAGEGTLKLDDNVQPLRAGIVFQVWPGQRLLIETNQENPLSFYSVHYQYGLLEWEGKRAEWKEAEGPLPIGEHFTVLGNRELEESFHRLLHLWNQKDPSYEWETRVGFLEVLRLVAAAARKTRSVEESGSTEVVREVIVYMKAHYTENLTRDSMAQHVTLSPAYFSSLFKKHTGVSPIQYLTRLRLDRAKQLLKMTKMPIKQVAEEVGFDDSFYFTRIFTKETGMSPRSYRQS